jgi:hypothetical protein
MTSSPANIREQIIAFSKNKQAAIGTANTAAGMWRFNKLNSSFGGPKLVKDDDAKELGKGNEFIANTFKTYWDVQGQIDKYASAEFAAWAFAFALGNVVQTGSPSNYTYTITPLDPIVDGIELPYFSFVEQVRPGPTAILDRMSIGCAIQTFTLSIASGPGRASAKITVTYVGSGKHAKPSVITIPAATAEKLLSNATLALTINGTDYVTTKKIVNLELTWNNNLRVNDGFYPGSGVQGAQKQIEVITLTGSSGTATVAAAGGLTKTATYGDSLTDTAGDFVTSFAADYDAQGIVVTSSGASIIFTAKVAGTGFTAPTIVNATTNLAGTVYHMTPNVTAANSGAVRGRLECGDRELGMKFTARFQNDSPELNAIEAETEGTAVIGLTYDSNNSLVITVQRVQITDAELGDNDGLLTVSATVSALWHSANGLISVVSKCNIDGIAGAEA